MALCAGLLTALTLYSLHASSGDNNSVAGSLQKTPASSTKVVTPPFPPTEEYIEASITQIVEEPKPIENEATATTPQRVTNISGFGLRNPEFSEVSDLLNNRKNFCADELLVGYGKADRRDVDWAWCIDKVKRHKIELGFSW